MKQAWQKAVGGYFTGLPRYTSQELAKRLPTEAKASRPGWAVELVRTSDPLSPESEQTVEDHLVAQEDEEHSAQAITHHLDLKRAMEWLRVEDSRMWAFVTEMLKEPKISEAKAERRARISTSTRWRAQRRNRAIFER